ncbi:hypothetical protein BJL95_00480 [Methylomonas sp. LWB]|uniref:CHASE2 domain-containing protein n=1 Tax=Methylomonas sp. LWB TaxID=1905845 RepID=UPI0008DB0B73|nr:CHASE2 domain-containing protein [Methylomonas sp. LWB]OHX35064.1 hypothetical protein BJL95_00480 [Methylomonas sp. LWB]
MQIDPFGLESATQNQSEKFFNKYISSFFYPEDNQNKITVVLIDEKRQSGPPSYNRQARLIKTVLDHQPKAIFIDLDYKLPHPSPDGPSKLIETLEQAKVPVYLAVTAEPSEVSCMHDNKEVNNLNEHKESKDFTNLVYKGVRVDGKESNDKIQRTITNWSKCKNKYPLRFKTKEVSENDGYISTPAFAMFEKYCEAPENNERCKEVAKIKNSKNDIPPSFLVTWGRDTSDYSAELLNSFTTPDGTDATQSKCSNYDLIEHFIAWLKYVVKIDSVQAPRSICPYTNTIVSNMFNGSPKDVDCWMRILLRDKYVFIGAAMDYDNDSIPNPINGKVPGVYLHAMAFDNLLTLGYEYYIDVNDSQIFNFVALSLMSFFIAKRERLLEDRFPEFLVVILTIVLITLPMSLLLMAFVFLFHITPSNFVALAVMPFNIKYISDNVVSEINELTKKTAGKASTKTLGFINKLRKNKKP